MNKKLFKNQEEEDELFALSEDVITYMKHCIEEMNFLLSEKQKEEEKTVSNEEANLLRSKRNNHDEDN